jgi:hypothetical protein
MILSQREDFELLLQGFIRKTHVELVVNQIKVQVANSVLEKSRHLGLHFLKVKKN